jgi:hypothetical protein
MPFDGVFWGQTYPNDWFCFIKALLEANKNDEVPNCKKMVPVRKGTIGGVLLM